MSKTGHHNFFNRAQKTDRIVRGILVDREVDLFISDIGDEPMSKEQAFELGCEGGLPMVERVVGYHNMPTYGGGSWWDRVMGKRRVPIRKIEQPQPALPVDAIRPFESGLALYQAFVEQEDQERYQRELDRYDDYYDIDYPEPTAVEWVGAAFWEAEMEADIRKDEQEAQMWAELDRQRFYDNNPTFGSF